MLGEGKEWGAHRAPTTDTGLGTLGRAAGAPQWGTEGTSSGIEVIALFLWWPCTHMN